MSGILCDNCGDIFLSGEAYQKHSKNCVSAKDTEIKKLRDARAYAEKALTLADRKIIQLDKERLDLQEYRDEQDRLLGGQAVLIKQQSDKIAQQEKEYSQLYKNYDKQFHLQRKFSAKVLKVLKLMEWIDWAGTSVDASPCPACYRQRRAGHDDSCKLAKLMRQLEE